MNERWVDTRELPGARSYPVQLMTALYWTAAAIGIVSSVSHSGGHASRAIEHFALFCPLHTGASAAVQSSTGWWVLGGIGASIAAWQIAWGVYVYRDPSERSLSIGGGASLGIALLWLATRTVGLPVGPLRDTPLQVGIPDAAAALDELTIAILGAAMIVPRWRRHLGAKGVELAVLGILIASGVALMATGHHH